MHRTPLSLWCLALLLSVASTVNAQGSQGVALRWNACFGEGTGLLARNFACNTNAGREVLVGSFKLSEEMTFVAGNEIVVDLTTGKPYVPSQGGPLPEWWKFRSPGTCRQSALSVGFFTESESEACRDWAGGQAVGLIGDYRIEQSGPGTARLVMASAIARENAPDLIAGTEYFSFMMLIRHDKTVGAGACAGCDTPLAIVLNSIKLIWSAPGNDRVIAGPLNGTDSHLAFWQSAVVPTHKSSWGAVKSLFR